MITENEPIKGVNIDEIRIKLGLSISDACWVFGIARPDWTTLIASHDPVSPALAELIRFYNAYPEYCPAKSPIDIGDLYERLSDASEGDVKRPDAKTVGTRQGRRRSSSLDLKAFSVMLGKEGSAAYRWVKMGANAAVPVVRMMEAMDAMLKKGENPVNLFIQLANTEAKARDVEDVWATGSWTGQPKRGEADKSSSGDSAVKKAPAKRYRKSAVETEKQ